MALALGVGAAGMMALPGCQAARVPQPMPAKLFSSAPDDQMEFWHTLAQRKLTANDDAFHGLLLYLDQKDDNADYAHRVAALKARKMLPADFNSPADESVSRGTLAVAIVEALRIKGGLMLTVLGPTPRYAVRELQFIGLYPASSPNQTFSGAEFVGIIGKMDDYQNGDRAPVVTVPAVPVSTPGGPGM